MPRRVVGDPAVEPWAGSADEREALRAQAERERLGRERVAEALRIADFAAAESAGYDRTAVRRLAQLNAETGDDVVYLAEQLNTEGHVRSPGRRWDFSGVAACIGLLWPDTSRHRWPKHYGTYPGYLGGLRDRLTLTAPSLQVIGPRRHQYRCLRCGALWPTGWPGADQDDLRQVRCPDCGSPNLGVFGSEKSREHSIIDLHWLIFRFAPSPVGPCPVCGGARKLAARDYTGFERVLYWSCGQADERGRHRQQPDGHYMRSLARAEWESTAAHYAYWLAVDTLRLAERTGEATELPIGAQYGALDGSGERWIYGDSGWEQTPD